MSRVLDTSRYESDFYASPPRERTSEFARLEKFHLDYVQHHSSPARAKFAYEFSTSPRGSPTKKLQKTASPLPERFGGLRYETTNQFGYMSYGDAVKLPAFAPSTMYRVMKAPTHEYTEAMFREWNTSGKISW